jgi:hypothetical protein
LAGEEAIFLPASRKSGGFGLSTRKLLRNSPLSMDESRILGYGRFSPDGEIRIPESLPIDPGQRLLTVFGSGYALGFISLGPIYAEASKHPELDEFKKEQP